VNIWKIIAERVPPPAPASIELMQATLESARHNQDLAALRKQIPQWWALTAHNGGQLGMLFGFYGYCRGLMERGAFRTWGRRLIIKAALAFGHWSLNRHYPGRPGWNDYYMTLWFVTGKPEYLEELYRRCTARPWPGAVPDLMNTYATARWMVFSVRTRVPDFDQALSVLENDRGERVELPGFADFAPGYVETIEAVPDYGPAGPAGPAAV